MARQDNMSLRSDIESLDGKVAWLTSKLQDAEQSEIEARRAAREVSFSAICLLLTMVQASLRAPWKNVMVRIPCLLQLF